MNARRSAPSVRPCARGCSWCLWCHCRLPDADAPARDGPEAPDVTRLLPFLLAAAIAIGAAAHLLGAPHAGDAVWAVAVVTALVPLTASVARSLRRGDVGVDMIA